VLEQRHLSSTRAASSTAASTTYLFDPVNGVVGYRATPGSPASVTPGLALADTVQLPDGFQCSLPVVLYGDTTIVQDGKGLFSGPLAGNFSLTLAAGTLAITGAWQVGGSVTAIPPATLEGPAPTAAHPIAQRQSVSPWPCTRRQLALRLRAATLSVVQHVTEAPPRCRARTNQMGLAVIFMTPLVLPVLMDHQL
jgi:hypothetical protein